MTPEAATLTLAAFLAARLDDDEEAALDAAGWTKAGTERAPGRWSRFGIASVKDDEGRTVIYSDAGQVDPSVADHAARHDPARVLADVAAKRAVLDSVDVLVRGEVAPDIAREVGLTDILRHLAAVYSDAPDYDERWRP